MEQLSFFKLPKKEQQQEIEARLDRYDYIVLAFSGGKDSTAAFLHLLNLGVDPDKIELWHHDVDGRNSPRLFDWPCTDAYCEAFAEAFDTDIYYSWKPGGFEREMNRNGEKSTPTKFETPDGVKTAGGGLGKSKTVQKFPAVGAIENGRWCSAILKIDVARIALNNQDRFHGKKVLFVTGERAQESPRRAKYNPIEVHKSDNRNGKRNVRHIDHWRPVLYWDEVDVWDIIGRYKINVHPAYHLGINRVSCAWCIFASPDQLATVNLVIPEQGRKIRQYEIDFNHTIRQDQTLDDTLAQGEPFEAATEERIQAARSSEFNQPIILDNFTLPAAAFGDSAGPT